MNQEIAIVNRGRGLQLSTNRITVQDLVPYFQDGSSYEEILDCIPTLTRAEISVVESYYRQHQAELDEEDRRIRQRCAQRQNPAWIDEVLQRAGDKMAALRGQFNNRKQAQGKNGDQASR